MSRKKTHEEFVNEMKIINPNITILGLYKGIKSKIECKCARCGHRWCPTPDCLIRGKGCPNCKILSFKKRNTMTNDEFIIKLKNTNPNLTPLENYVKSSFPIEFLCNTHNKRFKASPNSLFCGNKLGCEDCSGRYFFKTKEEVDNWLLKNKENIECLNFGGSMTSKSIFKCKIDNYVWKTTFSNVKFSTGCPKCGSTLKLTHSEFEERVYAKNNNVEILDEYTLLKNKIKTKCKICDFIWTPFAYNLMSGEGCPNCNKSKGEIKIEEIFILHNILFEPQKTFSNLVGLGNGLLSYDFYLPKYNLLIEYQGEFHDGKAKLSSNKKLIKQKEHDKRKKQYAIDNNIELLEIWYWDFDDIENILKQKLKI